MKHISEVFDDEPTTVETIEPTDEAQEQFGNRYGSELLEVTEEQIMALLEGKAWDFEVNGGEYAAFVVMKRKSI